MVVLRRKSGMQGRMQGWGGGEGCQGEREGREEDRRPCGRAQLGACPGREGKGCPRVSLWGHAVGFKAILAQEQRQVV